MNDTEKEEKKHSSDLTADKPTSYARKRDIFMSTDTQLEEAEISPNTTEKTQKEALDAFLAEYMKREEAAKKWAKYLDEKLKGKIMDMDRLQELISKGITPEEWEQIREPGDVIERPRALQEEVEDAWEKLKEEDEKFPEAVIEQMREQGLIPEEVDVFGGEYISIYDLKAMEAVWVGVYGTSLSDIELDEKEEIARLIGSGKPPVEAVVESLVVPDAVPDVSFEQIQGSAAVAVAEKIVAEAQKHDALVEDKEEEKEEVEQQEQMLERLNEGEDIAAESAHRPLEAQVSEAEVEEIRHEWSAVAGELRQELEQLVGRDYWDERGGDNALDALSKLGIRPETSRHGDDQPSAREVLLNALIPDSDDGITIRMQQAQALLPDVEINADMEAAILDAHQVGVGAVGKFGGDAGIFNLSLGQLREKREKLMGAGFSKSQADKLITYGIAGTVTVDDPTIFDPATKTDSRTKNLAEFIHRRMGDGGTTVDDNVLRQAMEIVQDVEKKSVLDDFRTPEELRAFANDIGRQIRTGVTPRGEEGTEATDQEIRRNLQLHLLETEMTKLAKDDGEGAMEWLNEQFDLIFNGSASGQELDSPVLRATENKVAYAIAYLNFKFGNRPEIAERFFNAFTYRQKLMIMRVVIGQRNAESLQGAAQQLRTHGLLSSFGFEDQNVRRMFMRMNDKLEDMRLNKTIGKNEKKVTSEMVRKMQQKLIDEEMTQFENLWDKSPYWNMVKNVKVDTANGETQEEAIRRAALNAITRSTRTAYDLFVSSQREALIVARGRNPKDDPEAYRSVPSGVFSFYGYEAMMWGGWDMKNVETMKFFDAIKTDIAEEALLERGLKKDALNWAEKIEYGGRRIQELSPVADFFSGGWRRDVMLEQLEDLMIFKYLSKETVERWEGEDRYKGITKAQIKDLLNEQSISLIQANGDRKIVSAKTDKELAGELKLLRNKFDFVREKKKTNDTEINDAIQKGKAKAQEFALFMRLHKVADGETNIRKGKKKNVREAKAAWDNIAQTKPEEIIRLLKDRLPIHKIGPAPTPGGHHESEDEEEGHGHGAHHDDGRPWHDELEPLNKRLAQIMGLSPAYYLAGETQKETQESAFDRFRDDYGSIITTLRENAMREDIPRALDLAYLTTEERKMVNNAMKDEHAAEKLMAGYDAMHRYIGEHTIQDKLTGNDVGVTQLLVQDYRFEHIYSKVQSIDDIFLDEIEQPPKVTGLLKVSDKYSTDPAGDGFRRTMNDSMDGIKAMNGLYKFITQEKPEAKMEGAQEYAAALGSANGQESIATALRFTYGSFLDLSKPYYWMDLFGMKDLPFRIPAAEIERIYGPEAHIFEREEIRQIIDRDLRFMLASSAGKKELVDQVEFERGEISAEEVKIRKEHYLHENEAMLSSLKERIGVTRGDERKTLAIQITLFLLFSLLIAALGAATAVATEESTGGMGGGGGGGGGHH